MYVARFTRLVPLAVLVTGLFALPAQAQCREGVPSDEAQATDGASLARVRRQLEREPGLNLSAAADADVQGHHRTASLHAHVR